MPSARATSALRNQGGTNAGTRSVPACGKCRPGNRASLAAGETQQGCDGGVAPAEAGGLPQACRLLQSIAWDLYTRAVNGEQAGVRLSADQVEDLDIDQRLRLGDREAVYDAIVDARARLEAMQDAVAAVLTDSSESIAAIAMLRERKRARGYDAPIDRFTKKKDAAATDRSGKEPQRSGKDRKSPANHGR